MISDKDFLLLKKLYDRYPPPECFDIRDAKNPTVAKRVWGDMAEKGYVKIKDSAVCGNEKIKGKFVSITEAGINAIFG